MEQVGYFEPELISIKNHPGLDEKWLQERLAENPKLLGLGDLVLKDKERIQPRAGRLDLLFQDPDAAQRFEVEVQLGRTDETHIIRTIEYWDIERKRYPQYDHCAVIVAEEITARFLNVIGLFNGQIPLIAIRLQAIRVNGSVGLVFTRVMDEVQLGPVDEDEPVQELTDRHYWENKGSPETVKLADRMLELIQKFAPTYGLNYNKHYIGLSENGHANNFAAFRPQRTRMKFELKLPQSEELTRRLENAGLELLTYDRNFGYYNISLSGSDIASQNELLSSVMKEAYEASI